MDIPGAHGALEDDDLAGLPRLDDGHPRDRRVRVLDRRAVDRVVRPCAINRS
jgi:hypothetical protein